MRRGVLMHHMIMSAVACSAACPVGSGGAGQEHEKSKEDDFSCPSFSPCAEEGVQVHRVLVVFSASVNTDHYLVGWLLAFVHVSANLSFQY